MPLLQETSRTKHRGSHVLYLERPNVPLSQRMRRNVRIRGRTRAGDKLRMSGIETALALFEGMLPESTTLTIEQHPSLVKSYPYMYVFRCEYTSKSSGRTMTVMAKGQSLPAERDNSFYFYLHQLTLTPAETAREFSRLYFLERRARQDAWNSGESGNIRVSGKSLLKDEQDGRSSRRPP
jgi:hypothetical protein